MRMSPLLKLLPDSCHWTPRVRVYQCFAPVWRSIWRELAGAAVAVLALVQPAAFAKAQPEGTHRQAAILKPDPELSLVSFVVSPGGEITAALAGPELPGNKHEPGFLRVYTPDRELLREIRLPVSPLAFSLFGDAGYLVVGGGKLLHVSAEGEVVREAEILKLLGSSESQLRANATKVVTEGRVASRKQSEREVADLEESIKKMESVANPTARQRIRIDSSKRMLVQRRAELERVSSLGPSVGEDVVDRVLEGLTESPSVSGDGKTVVLTLPTFRQYEVLKLDNEFRNPRRILGDLEGCCGQMDVFLKGDRIFTAENTRFKVGVYDLQGKKQREFGEKHRGENLGFGSCCNPMNVWVYPNGDVLTAESSIGTLKRFSPDGKLLGVIGRARIGEGCKHVAIGFDPSRDRYYVQYEDRNHICVLMPNAEAAPLVAEQDRQIATGEAMIAELAGSWKVEPRQGARSLQEIEALSADPESMSPEDWITVPVDGLEKLTLQPNHSVFFRPKTTARGKVRDRHLRWVVTGVRDQSVQLELEEPDGTVSHAVQIRKLSETAVELRIRNYTWTLNKS